MKKVIVMFSLVVGFVYAGSGKPVVVTVDNEHGHLCNDVNDIRGIDKHGDGFVAVRSGPGSKYSIKDKLYKNGKQIASCDRVGNWIGIVYSNKKARDIARQCDLNIRKHTKRHAYKGSCQSGWIYKKFLSEGYGD